MSFLRPEAKAGLMRWREVLAGLGVLALGAYWALFPGGLLMWIGWVVILLAIALIFAGVQRARFRTGTGGPGMVQVIEGRISYFGPLTGGFADLDSLTALTLDPRARPPHWLLRSEDGTTLAIPLTAEGADQLFDVFARLPGLQTERMLQKMQERGSAPVTIWQRASAQKPALRLH
ncbi:hypothetical protein [Salipiger sp. PrR002]|uniref:hypothetical protein n=1 Tax=Salipiger sp. PrR002 TaxID=2706489 RepID=UPI0013BE2972|nr:hypothetical protein [Salipiger sp. PrR002]NDW00253.1 hypothetical protein [Salipiger sp. PrR002]NDW58608.1 hypothetical protein [Salipiger sp. PrR004]